MTPQFMRRLTRTGCRFEYAGINDFLKERYWIIRSYEKRVIICLFESDIIKEQQ